MIKKWIPIIFQLISVLLSVFLSVMLPSAARSRRFLPLALAVLAFLSLLVPARLDAAAGVQTSLELFAATDSPSNTLIDNILRQVNISNDSGRKQLADAIKAVESRFPQKAGVLEGQLLLALDKRRMDLVNGFIDQVAAAHNLDAIVRTGSSGLRFLTRGGLPPGDVYRIFFSDDDISFVGEDALAARNMFNSLVAGAGLGNAKVGGFTINDLRARGYDTIGLELLDPEKYVGKSALQQLKVEMYKKGAVVYQRPAGGGPLRFNPQPLADFVVTRRDTMLSQYVGEGFRDATKRFGALTAVNSNEREIAYKGWEALDDAEKVKYVERELRALNTSGGLRFLGGMDDDAIEAQFEKLIEMKVKKSLSETDKQLLVEMRTRNVKLSLLEIPQKIDAIVGAVGFEATEGRVLAANPAVREAIEEFATGFALLDQSRGALKIDPDALINELLDRFPKGSDIYKVLYTAHMQGKDLLEALAAYTKGGLWNAAAQEAFLRDIEKLTTNEAKAAFAETTERKVAKAATKEELSVLQGIREMYKNALGGTFLDKLIRHPTGHRVALGLLVATGGRYLLNEMYESWARGSVKDDLTDCAWALVKFAPGVMTVEKAVTQGLSADTAISFVKDVMYFSPYWPFALMMDAAQVTVEIGSAMSLQNYQEGMIKILAVNGEFDPSGRFVGLRLLNGQDQPGELIRREEMAAFFTGQPGGVYPEKYEGILFPSRNVRVFNTNMKEQGVAFMADLGEAAGALYTQFYYPGDPVLNKLTKAYEYQRRIINTRESIGSLGDFEWGRAASSHFNWLMGYESVCAKSPETWCQVLGVLKYNMQQRQRRVVPDFMVPHMILMAEEMHKTLEAPTDLKDKLSDLQEKFEALRGGKDKELGVNLAEKVSAEADRLAQSGGDSGEKKVTRGEYWQKAFDFYQKMYDGTKGLKAEIARDTGFDRVMILRFPWSGNPLQDSLREGVSRRSFQAARDRIIADIAGFKKAKPDPADSVDKQAFEILGSVLFPRMMAMDTTTTLTPTSDGLRIIPEHKLPPGSNYDEEYGKALEKVEALYKKKGDFQALLDKGAKIVTAQPALMMGEEGDMELVFTDEELKKDLAAEAFTFKWSASPKGTFSPNDYNQKATFTAPDPGNVTITVRVERSVPKEEKLNASLAITVPVKVPDNFVRLDLIPAALKPEEKGKADTTLEQERFIGKLRYKWSGTNCQVEEVDRPSTSIIAPKTGQATVTVELFIKDAEGQWVSLITKQVSFSVDGKPDSKTGNKSKDEKPGADDKKDGKPGDGKPGAGDKKEPTTDDKKDGQKSQPQVQPDSYTKPWGQAGIQGGTSSQTGITSGVSGQTGITQQDPTTTTQTTGTTGTTQGTGTATGGTQGTTGTTGVSTGTGTGKDTPVGGQTGITSGVGTGVGIDKGTGQAVTTTPKEPPVCTYEYSAWGLCNRATKTWTRTVTAKQPAGCVEKGKPLLEERCTPPPTEEEKRNGYLSCLCRCYGGWDASIGDFYSPSGYPECGGSGPCVGGIGAFGACSRHFFGAPNECAKSCYEGTYGKGTYDEKKADKTRRDENKKLSKPLKLKLNDGKCPITAQLGDIITLTASVEGGIPPHKYTWTGNGQAKENTFTFANSRQPGSHPISVTVTDDEGNSATASCPVEVEAMTVKIELLDEGKKIPIGESRNFRGTVMSGDKPARGDFYFLWQPHPEILFSPFEKTGGNLTGTKAKFNKLGNFKVWVIAHTYKGDLKTTIGESEQIEIEVSKPELKLSFQPQTPKVGQEVKLTVTEKPKMDDKTISFWWEVSGNTLNPGPLKDEREYTFKPKDNKPVTVTVHGKAIEGGDDLGEDKATVTAQEYEVTIGEPRYRGPKPKIWKPQEWKSPEWKEGSGFQGEGGLTPGGGLVEVADNQFAVFQDIDVKADVKPTSEKLPLRYDWAITPSGICGIPGAGQELRLNCSQTGTYTVTLSVRDSDNVVLGTANRAVSITVSQEDLDNAKRPLVTLQADKTSLKTGETAVIKAAVQGGKAPYTYRWSDSAEGKGETARFSPKKTGAQNITIEVTDGAGKKNTASISIKVERAKLEVTVKAAKTDVKLGETVEIRAEAKGGEAPFTYTWGPGLTEKGDSVPFVPKKGGAQTVFVEVTDKAQQKANATVELKVEVPKLEVTLKADKTTLKIGETALIQAVVKGGVPPIASKWSAGTDAKGEAASFTPKKSGAFKITVDVSDSDTQKANAGIDLKVEPTKLEVTLKADKTTLKLGETAMLQATIKGGEPPFVSQWGSGVEGKGDSGRFVADKPGAHKATLDVSDQAGQKASASVDLKVEVPKLEIALTPDKPTLKVGEKGTIQANVKGGMPEYTYQWSSFVSGKGETAVFIPNKTGLYKVWLEVRDEAGGKATASLDWKVEEGSGGQTPQVGGVEKIAIEPESLKLALGETQTMQVLRVLPDGWKEPYTQGKVSWSGAGSQGIVISDQGKVQVTSLAKTGTRVKIEAQAGPLKAEAWVEVVSSSKTGRQAIEPDPLQVAPGGTGELRLISMAPDGKKEPVPTDRVKWEVERVTGVSIDSGGKVSVGLAVPVGKRIKVTAKADQDPVTGSIEVAGSSKTSSTIQSAGGSTTATTVAPSTNPTVSSTSVKTAVSTTPGGGGQTSPSGASPSPVLVMEPANLTIQPGGSAGFRVFTADVNGKRTDVTNKCTLTVTPDSGIKIDRNGLVTVAKTAKAGSIEPVLVSFVQAKSGTLRADGTVRIEGIQSSASGGYNPLTDRGKDLTVKTTDADKVTKITGDFQKGQWTPLDQKDQKIKDQQMGQAQSPDYVGMTSAATTSTGTSGSGTTTTQPTTADPSTTQSSTTTVGVTSKDLTDVTVDRQDVTITVWDHGIEDGDIINIYLNGKVLKSKLLLTNKKQSFKVKLTGGQNRFEVEAVNEGSSPPNTATVEISNVTKGKPSQVYERKSGQRASMNLNAP